ncbi:MAG: ferrochelatase [Colwellia sp.]|nr:ferrochelatase [Colwellia sp.]
MKSRFSAKKHDSKQCKDNNAALKVGVLLTNLGSPAAPNETAVRNYLREFLSDPRVVEIPRVIWMLILHGFVLRFRPKKSAKLYESVWTEQGAPLLVISQAQQQKVATQIKQQFGEDVIVDVAMRYGEPSISSVLQKFQQQGVDKLVVLPLYPQYAGPTTASTFDAVSKELQQWRYVPSVHFINSYHNNALYIEALANSVTEHLAKHGTPDKLVLSYHGMPELFYQWGDPYFDFCKTTTNLLKKKLLSRSLGLTDDTFVMTFQSRFGKAKWLQPYTDETLAILAKEGNKHLAIMSPAFSADCLETLEELECENREVFMEAGGEKYHYIAALNDRGDHVEALVSILTPLLNE